MASPSVRMTTAAKPGLAARKRKASRMSCFTRRTVSAFGAPGRAHGLSRCCRLTRRVLTGERPFLVPVVAAGLAPAIRTVTGEQGQRHLMLSTGAAWNRERYFRRTGGIHRLCVSVLIGLSAFGPGGRLASFEPQAVRVPHVLAGVTSTVRSPITGFQAADRAAPACRARNVDWLSGIHV